MSLTAAERLARLRLARTDGIGPVGHARLLARHGDAATALVALEQEGRPTADAAAAAAEMADAERLGFFHLFLGEDRYPPLLARLSDPPPVLLAAGDPALAHRPVVAIVGARNASAAGMRLAEEMAADLGAAGWVVVSGLARGIDGAAHRGALATGTIGCVAGGPDIIYPPEHERLQHAIAARGLLLSEMPCGVEPLARHFPRRNRLIAGCASGLVVIEAALGSGSMISARLAGEAGRDVMAVPGHPRDPRSRGPNALIKEGAALVESAADVVAVLSPFMAAAAPPARTIPVMAAFVAPAAPAPPPAAAGGAAEALLLDLLSATPVAIDELVRRSGLDTGFVQAFLVTLEIEGRLIRHAGGRVALDAAAGAH
jgi:DNA processing protein